MKITSVDVHKVETNDPRMKGFATVKIDDCFLIRDIRIREGKNGLFLAMPNRKTSSGKYVDSAHPINKETRQMFLDAVLEEYNKQD